MQALNSDVTKQSQRQALNKSNKQTSMQLGKFYEVRCLRTDWSKTNKPEWIPVIGPIHDDRDHIKFDEQHFHVDFRFLGKKLRIAAAEHRHGNRGINLVFVLPISKVLPLQSDSWLKLNDPMLQNFPEESYMKTMKLKFKTEYPEYDFEPPWLLSMETAYRNARLGPDMICPHRGTDLNGMKTDENGLLTCPLHGLRWDTKTGKLAPSVTPREPLLRHKARPKP